MMTLWDHLFTNLINVDWWMSRLVCMNYCILAIGSVSGHKNEKN